MSQIITCECTKFPIYAALQGEKGGERMKDNEYLLRSPWIGSRSKLVSFFRTLTTCIASYKIGILKCMENAKSRQVAGRKRKEVHNQFGDTARNKNKDLS